MVVFILFLQAVQQVLANLLISKIELRTDDCRDVQPYVKDRLVRQIKVPLTPEIEEYKQLYKQVIRCFWALVLLCFLSWKDVSFCVMS